MYTSKLKNVYIVLDRESDKNSSYFGDHEIITLHIYNRPNNFFSVHSFPPIDELNETRVLINEHGYMLWYWCTYDVLKCHPSIPYEQKKTDLSHIIRKQFSIFNYSRSFPCQSMVIAFRPSNNWRALNSLQIPEINESNHKT